MNSLSLKKHPDSIREKGYRNLQPLAPDAFGYSVIRNTVETEIYQEIIQLSETMDFPIEVLHEESGPGVIEAAITVDNAIAAADKAALLKTFIKVALQRMGCMATFMGKVVRRLARAERSLTPFLTRLTG